MSGTLARRPPSYSPAMSGTFSSSADERVGWLTRSRGGRAVSGLATVVLGFVGARGVITHSTAGLVAFGVFAAVVAVLAIPENRLFRPLPTLLLGVFLAILGFVGVGGAHNTRAGWFSLFWLALGALGLLLVLRAARRPT